MSAHEACAIGHPDKVADQISDAILDAYLTVDPTARVDINSIVSHDKLFLCGEITSTKTVDIKDVARGVLEDVGYKRDCSIDTAISLQSQDIAEAVKAGAGDQGIMVGYATDETREYMPMASVIAQKLMDGLKDMRPSDGKTLVGMCYKDLAPDFIPFIILSYQHKEEISLDAHRAHLLAYIKKTVPEELLTQDTEILINPGGRFVVGGCIADTGLTGRKLMADTYGTASPHGGGAFSGKDPTKPDRSAAYAARYIAKNIVAAKLAERCQVTLYYAIGSPLPINISINTYGTAKVSDAELEKAVSKLFDLSITGIISQLKLQRPIYRKTAWGGHFGRSDPDFLWESCDKAAALQNYFA